MLIVWTIFLFFTSQSTIVLIFYCCPRRLWWIWCGIGNTREFSGTLDSPVVQFFKPIRNEQQQQAWTKCAIGYMPLNEQNNSFTGTQTIKMASNTTVFSQMRKCSLSLFCLTHQQRVLYSTSNIVPCELFACVGNSLYIHVCMHSCHTIATILLLIPWEFQSGFLNFVLTLISSQIYWNKSKLDGGYGGWLYLAVMQNRILMTN